MLCTSIGYGQQFKSKRTKQEILKAISTAKPGEEKAFELSAMGFYYRKNEFLPDSSLFYFNEMLDHSIKTDYPLGESRANQCIGDHYLRHNELDKGIKYVERALFLSDSISNTKFLGVIHRSIGNYYYRKNQFDSSYVHFTKSLQFIDESQYGIKANLLFRLGDVMVQSGDLEKAESYHLQAISVFEEQQDSFGLYIFYSDLNYNYIHTYPDPKKFAQSYSKLGELNVHLGINPTAYHSNDIFAIDKPYEELIAFISSTVEALKESKYDEGVINAYTKIIDAQKLLMKLLTMQEMNQIKDINLRVNFIIFSIK